MVVGIVDDPGLSAGTLFSVTVLFPIAVYVGATVGAKGNVGMLLLLLELDFDDCV